MKTLAQLLLMVSSFALIPLTARTRAGRQWRIRVLRPIRGVPSAGILHLPSGTLSRLASLAAVAATAEVSLAAVSGGTRDALSAVLYLALIQISEPTRPRYTSYAGFCLKKKTLTGM